MKIVKYAFYGALTGLCIGLVLSFFVGCDAVGSCADEWLGAFFNSLFGCGGNASCSGGCQEFTSDPAVRNCMLYSILISTGIGAIYGLFLTMQDKNAAQKAALLSQSAEAKKQRAAWASEIKQNALKVTNTCTQNKVSDKPLVSTTYKANTQMSEIVNELAKVAEKQGKIDSLADELSKKGGASL